MAPKNKNSSLLRFMSETEMKMLFSLGRPVTFNKKTCLFLQGDPGDFFYVTEKGEVQITTTSPDGKDVIIQKLGSGDIFGEIAMFKGQERTTSAYAEKGAQLIAIEREKFLTFLDQKPALYQGIIALLCTRLRWSSKLLESLVFADSLERLATRLLYLAEYHGRNNAIAISQADLGKMLALSRESVNKNLRILQAKKLVAVSRKKIAVVSPEKLSSFIKERK